MDVVLVHGLWTPAAVMWPIGSFLARRHYAPRYFYYRGREDFDGNVALLRHYIGRVGQRCHFVGHSLGGLLLLRALNSLEGTPIGRTVMLAPPVRGAESARRLRRCWLGRVMLGQAAEVLSAGIDAYWRRREPLGVVVGTGRFGLGRLLGPLEGDNDGVVRETETRVAGSTDTLRIPSAHTPMLFSRELAEAVGRFLDTARFNQR